MDPASFISDVLYVKKTKGMGRGVFTHAALEEGEVIEIAPVIVMSREDRAFIDRTLLHDYIFEWGKSREECCLALGYVSLYNHSYTSNCEYEMNFKKQLIAVRTVRAVKAGEELFINYNGQWNNAKPLWFDAK